MTATPCRQDGRGLGGTFDVLVECPQVEKLVEMGYLVRTRVFAPSTPSLKGVHVRQGDYVVGELERRVNTSELVGDIVTHWHRLAERRPTVVFATSVAHSIHLAEEFAKSGVKAAHIDGKTPKDERDVILAQLSRGDLELVTNCMVLTEGWDQPQVSCCVLARPTKSMGLYRQMAGRVIRPAPGKADAIILDHAGSTFAHGFVEDPIQWTLDPDTKADNKKHKTRSMRVGADKVITCTECSAIRTAGKPCPECGHMPKRPGEDVEVQDGELQRLDGDGRLHPHHYSLEAKQVFYRGLLAIAMARQNKIGVAAYRYRDRFDEWPPREWMALGPIQPTAEVSAWDKHCRVRYAESRHRQQQAAAAAHG
jgi:DNA repair protein RadD